MNVIAELTQSQTGESLPCILLLDEETCTRSLNLRILHSSNCSGGRTIESLSASLCRRRPCVRFVYLQ